MANFSTILLQLVVLFILEQYSIAQTSSASDEPDRILKKRGDDAWFLEKSVGSFFSYHFSLFS